MDLLIFMSTFVPHFLPLRTKLTLSFITIYLLLSNCSFAGRFIVTSNADNGVGTLREALQMAADNGSSVTDTILFNLPNSFRADRTIVLDSTLPLLSSHLIIDGTSQNGTPFGISDARVQIENKYSVYDDIYSFIFLKAKGINDIQIYGLYLKGVNAAYAIDFIGVNNMIFGKPGKGNIVNGFQRAFYSFQNPLVTVLSTNISFQSNLLGIDESGDFANNSTYNNIHFKFLDVFNLLIGGLGKDEGNLMCDENNAMDWSCTTAEDSGYLRIEGNKIGTDRTGLKSLITKSWGISLNGYNDGAVDSPDTSGIDVSIINNISAEGISLISFKNYFKIQGNRFGVGLDNISNIAQSIYPLTILSCKKGIIGGPNPADKNYIGNFSFTPAIRLLQCGSITVSKNSLFCNGNGILLDWVLYTRPKPFVAINKISATRVGGTSLPNSIIELFYDDACPGCEGKTYIGSTTADANGNWIYNGNNSGGIVATATDTYGATSEFSSATINTDSIQVKDATCGRANGAIKHLRVVSGTDWYWQDEAGNIIARDTNLVNVPPGKYKFITSIGGNSCKTESILYEIKNVPQPFMDTSVISIQQPSCGMNNGAFKNTIAFNDSFQYQWINNANDVLLTNFGQQNPFANLGPGNYFLKLRLLHDSTCFVNYGPFKLVNQSGPALHTESAKIVDASCGANKGSIKNITYENATGAVYNAWEDSTGKIVGTNLDITELAKGKYRLKFKDGGGCDTIITPWFTIRDLGTITADTRLMKANPSSCKGSDGSITGIAAINADSFTWTDIATGNIVGQDVNVYGLKAGTYQLEMNNSFGCTDSMKVSIRHSGFLTDTVVDAALIDANCFLDNGAIKINWFTRDSSLYSFKWTNTSTNAIISTHTSIYNLAAGFYELTATDTSGCSQVIFAANIPQIGKPGFDTHALKIFDDTCSAGRGAILNLTTRDSSRIDSIRAYTWAWYNDQQQVINTAANNLYSVKGGTYYATITDQFNCTTTSNPITVFNKEIIPAKPRADDQYIARNTATQITVLNPQQGLYQLLNDDLSGSIPLAASANGILQTPVIATDRSFFIRYADGDCESPLSEIVIKVFDSTVIYVPNAFTPNYDGVNDRFHVIVNGRTTDFHISVYNRFGNLVYASNDVNGNWDGTLRGEPVPVGVFVYVITARTYENRNIQQKGTLMLLR